MARALVFAHYDRDGIFDPHVVRAIIGYRSVVDRLVVVSTSTPRLPDELRSSVDDFITRDNVGYDFCSWRDGIQSLARVGDYDEIVCANDSVYGPLFDLAPVFRDPRIAAADFWGMCLSEQGTKRRGRTSCPHVQSWFFVMRRPLLESLAFADFWRTVEPQACKDDVIDRFEVGMTEHFARAGFQTAALYDARSRGVATWAEIRPHVALTEPRRSWRHMKKARRRPHNPSELFPLRLLAAGVPFLKVGMFRVNHYGLSLPAVRDSLRVVGTYDVGLIDDHLARVGRSVE
jgi:lipopolysaccharide biosynthesis protein